MRAYCMPFSAISRGRYFEAPGLMLAASNARMNANEVGREQRTGFDAAS